MTELPIHFQDELLLLEELSLKIKNFEIAVDEVLSKSEYDEYIVKDLQNEVRLIFYSINDKDIVLKMMCFPIEIRNSC
jgi:hypothetical protein